MTEVTEKSANSVNYLLDGQQRVTSLYSVIRGRLPSFHSSDDNPVSGLLFHVEDRVFAFERTRETRQHDPKLWVSVSQLFEEEGVDRAEERIEKEANLRRQDSRRYARELDHLVVQLKGVDLPILELNDVDLSIEDVVSIFNKINKGGKALTPYELAFSVLSAQWPEVRDDFQKVAARWEGRIDTDVDWLLRVVNAVATNSGKMSIEKVNVDTAKQLLKECGEAIDHLLNLLSERLGLEHSRYLKQRLPFAVMVKFVLQQEGHRITESSARDKLLYWYVLSSIFGRYLRAPETRMTSDLAAVDKGEGGLDELIELLRRDRPSLQVDPEDLNRTLDSAFYLVLYMLTRVYGAKDWQTGEEIRYGMLGKASALDRHHIFPQDILKTAKVDKALIDNLANFAFQTSKTNKSIGNDDPADYLPKIAQSQQGALESQWIPMDSSKWQVSNFEEFLKARRSLLAQAANDFLTSLHSGVLPEGANQPIVRGHDDRV